MKSLWKRTFKLRVAINMLVCALVFGAFGSLPRETISGFLGRRTHLLFWHKPWRRPGQFALYLLCGIVDWLHPKEMFHCLRVAREEEAGWRAMYPERYR